MVTRAYFQCASGRMTEPYGFSNANSYNENKIKILLFQLLFRCFMAYSDDVCIFPALGDYFPSDGTRIATPGWVMGTFPSIQTGKSC